MFYFISGSLMLDISWSRFSRWARLNWSYKTHLPIYLSRESSGPEVSRGTWPGFDFISFYLLF